MEITIGKQHSGKLEENYCGGWLLWGSVAPVAARTTRAWRKSHGPYRPPISPLKIASAPSLRVKA